MRTRAKVRLLSVAALCLTLASAGKAQIGSRCSAGTMLPDSAYPDIPRVRDYLVSRGFVVRCVTSSTMQGTADLNDVAGFQTDRGTFTVFFIPAGEDVRIREQHLTRGRFRGYYEYTFLRSSGGQTKKHVVQVNGPWYFVRRGNWLINVSDSTLVKATSSRPA